MSLPRQSSLQRGASVLAALVIAAALASISLLVQQGSPVAYTQSQVASPAPTQSGETGSAKTSTNCNPGSDYMIDGTGKLSEQKVCSASGKSSTNGSKKYPDQPASDLWGSMSGRCVSEKNEPPKAGADWKCVVKRCKADGATKKDTCNDYYYADKETPIVSKGNAGDGKEPSAEDMALANKVLQDPSLLNKVAPEQRPALLEALRAQEDAMDAKQQAIDSDRTNVSNAIETCSFTGCTDEETKALQEKKDKISAEQSALDDQYESLSKVAKALDATSGPPGAGSGQIPVGILDCKGNTACEQAVKERDAARQAVLDAQRKQSQTGFGGQGSGTGAGGLGNLAKGLGGGSGSGGGSGAGQQQPQQQQCQPQYQCTTSGTASTVMYNQCPQQNSQWQTYQQCPTGYTCQNNGCVATAPYGYCTSGQPRTAPAQAQPAASSCTVGTWTDASNGCQTNWQCTAGAAGSPTAQLSCQPLVAASGTVITFSYVCANGATAATASNFTIPTATTLSGTATTSAQKPADGTSSVTYGLTCTNANVSPSLTASAQCAVQVGNAAIVLVATPEKIAKTETEDLKRKSTVGWVTSGMQSCVISNADFIDWTSQQAGNTSVSGAAVSPIITADTIFKLTCQTLGGTTASSTVKVLSI